MIIFISIIRNLKIEDALPRNYLLCFQSCRWKIHILLSYVYILQYWPSKMWLVRRKVFLCNCKYEPSALHVSDIILNWISRCEIKSLGRKKLIFLCTKSLFIFKWFLAFAATYGSNGPKSFSKRLAVLCYHQLNNKKPLPIPQQIIFLSMHMAINHEITIFDFLMIFILQPCRFW